MKVGDERRSRTIIPNILPFDSSVATSGLRGKLRRLGTAVGGAESGLSDDMVTSGTAAAKYQMREADADEEEDDEEPFPESEYVRAQASCHAVEEDHVRRARGWRKRCGGGRWRPIRAAAMPADMADRYKVDAESISRIGGLLSGEMDLVPKHTRFGSYFGWDGLNC